MLQAVIRAEQPRWGAYRRGRYGFAAGAASVVESPSSFPSAKAPTCLLCSAVPLVSSPRR